MKFKLFLLTSLLVTTQARLVNRIIGGYNAVQNSFPNLVSLQGYEDNPQLRVHFCGGTIVTPLWILVNAECALVIGPNGFSKDNVRVYAGKWNLSQFEPNQQIRRVKEVYPHPDFNEDILRSFDIGLLELTVALVFNMFVKAFPISSKIDYPSGTAVIAGWGAAYLDEIITVKPTSVLQVKNVTIVSRQDCLDAIKELLEEYNNIFDTNIVNEYIFCSGSYTSITGSSFADCGNPIMQLNESGDYDIIGVTSATATPFGNGGPSVFVRATPFIKWIKTMTGLE